MIRLILIFVIITFWGCDLKSPSENSLLDLRTAVNFFDINKVNTNVLRFPSNDDITATSGWSILNNVFDITINTSIVYTDSNSYLSNISYDIFLETNRYFSLIGVDSLISNVDLEIINTNTHYDDTDRLDLVISQLQYKTTEDENYQSGHNLDSLKNIELEMKFRYFFRISSGYNYHSGVIPGDAFFPNSAKYRIRLKLLGFYL